MTELKIGTRVWVSFPDKPHLDSEGFILIGPVRRGDQDIWQVDMGDHDNWFPTGWLTPLDQGGSSSKR